MSVAEFAEALGHPAVRLPLLGLTAFLCAFAFTGWIPPARALAIVVPFGLVAAALLAALHVWIGLLAFWLHDVSPVYWVCQKVMFVLGGLMLPLELYPGVDPANRRVDAVSGAARRPGVVRAGTAAPRRRRSRATSRSGPASTASRPGLDVSPRGSRRGHQRGVTM